MQHYFGKIDGNFAYLSEEDLHHFLRVKRAERGEEVEISYDGSLYLCVVKSLDPLSIAVLSKLDEHRELPGKLALAFALLKGDHHEEIILKGTELGVSEFFPFTSKRTIVRLEGKPRKIERLSLIAKEGAEQCRRNSLPLVHEPCSFNDLLALPFDHRLLAYEDQRVSGAKPLYEYASNLQKGESVLVLIGPEGGFEPLEATKAIESGFVPVSLGKRILRAETAALCAAAVISSTWEGKA